MRIDIHSHQFRLTPGHYQILSVGPADFDHFDAVVSAHGKSVSMSLGIHPWDAPDWELNAVLSQIAHFLDQRVLMIGEIGLDKKSSVPLNIQTMVFRTQIEMAEKAGKPVLLHVVHAMSEMLEAKRTHPNIPAWIIHGFRGGKQEAEQYISKGFYLSFGPNFNKEGLLACPPDRFFLETDNSGVDIDVVYCQVEKILQYSKDNLEKQIESNYSFIFDKFNNLKG